MITDANFYDASWMHELRADSDTGSQSVSRQIPPEDPTGYQEGIHNWGPGTIRTAHFYVITTFTPSSQGAADSFDISFAFRMPYGSATIRDMQAGPALRQGAQVYVYSSLQTYPEDPTWGSFTSTGLLASDFGLVTASGVDFNTNPDFSCTGGAIEFGYTTERSSTKTGSSLTWNIDGLAVTVHYTTAGDCNGNGISDECEIDNGITLDCNGNNIPDDCDISAGTSLDCNGNNIPDECDIASGTSQDCNSNGIPDDCETDCNGNGIPDDCDITSGTSLDCNGNDVPDECDIASGASQDCNGNTVPDECDIASGASQDCNSNGVPDECDIASGTSQDCNGNTVPDECDLASGASADCNVNGTPDECEPDCNGNGIADECDITSGTSLDCNNNGVPDDCEPDCNNNGIADECDITSGTSLDCNLNGIPDECDFASGASDDCNNNDIPDECESYIEHKLTASDGASDDLFGYSVSISGDIALIGAYKDDDNGSLSGSAYCYRYNGSSWVEEAKLTASDAAYGDQFGYSVSISNNMAVIGALANDDHGRNSGSAYVFRYDGINWIEEAKLTASDAAMEDDFGYSVSISGDVAVIGACYDDDGGSASGSAYVFRYNGTSWIEEAKLTASDAEPQDVFGYTVSINGDVAIIGACGNDDNDSGSGSAYVYRYTGSSWIEEAKLTASDAAENDQFGKSVAISGIAAVIGALYDDDGGGSSGSAYVFRFNGTNWIEEAKLTASDAAISDYFGCAVSIDGDVAVIGAYGNDDGGYDSGSAYQFRFYEGNWVEEAKLTASDALSSDRFGQAVAVSANRALIGAYQDYTGSAYVTTVPNSSLDQDCNRNGTPDDCDIADGVCQDCNNNALPDECDIASGTSQDYNGNGIPDECETDCNGNGIPDDSDISEGTSQDCNSNNVPDECDTSSGTSADCNANDVPDECEPDCNSNGIADECDITAGTSQDYNGNGLPDECDLANGTSSDCNGNNIPDDGEAYVEHKLLLTDAAEGDQYGDAVSISGDVAVVGAYANDDNGNGSGSAYVYRWNGTTWDQQAKLIASDASIYDYFGRSVSVSGNLAIIGAFNHHEGAAYVFRYNGFTWIEEAKLTASDGESNDSFGCSVSIDGDVVLIGAQGDDDGGSAAGAAYVFRRIGYNWVEEVKLTASDPVSYDKFGQAVAINGDVALIGAPEVDVGGANVGAAYVFRFDGSSWVEESKLTASDGASNDYFAAKLSIYENVVVIGAYFKDDVGINSGSAYVFRFNGSQWAEEAKLTASDAAAYDNFGRSVSLRGDTIVVGSSADDDGEINTGSVYVYRWDGTNWLEETKLLSPNASTQYSFGLSVSISGNSLIVGESGNDVAGMVAGAAYIYRHNGSDWELEAEPTPLNVKADDWFGESVAFSGDVAVIGAYGDDDIVNYSGSAYVYRLIDGTWVRQAKLKASDAETYDYFGTTVAVSGEVAVIGAYGNDDAGEQSGSAYIFRYDGSTWVEEAKLTASDAVTSDLFGLPVAISGDVALIGAHGNDDAGSKSGSAYIFRFNGTSWIEEAKLTASDAAEDDKFGFSVTISDSKVVIGAYVDDHDGGIDAGSAYVYRFNGTNWVEETKLTASDASASAHFGCSASSSGDKVVIGAKSADAGVGIYSGAAYAFRYDGSNWLEEAKLIAPDADMNDYFGKAVTMSGDVAVIGAYGDDDDGDLSGSAYIYRYDGSSWQLDNKLTASDAAAADYFGYEVSVSGNKVMIGAYGNDDGGSQAGSAYVFNLPDPAMQTDCNANGIPDSCDLDAGTSPDCNQNGLPDECDIFAGTSQDCNANGIPDECDVSSQTSQDCNTNGIPDECDIADGTSGDCNTNGIPDECDISSGTSEDCNANIIPDSCEIFYETILLPSDPRSRGTFGSEVAISGDRAVIGAPYPGDCGYDGSAYIYHFNGSSWVEEIILKPPTPYSYKYFGSSVAIDGHVVMVGSYGSYYNFGVCVYRCNGTHWVQETILTASYSGSYGFGSSISISGDVALIGASSDDEGGDTAGAVYVFRFNGSNWVEEAKLTASDAAPTAQFGSDVSINNNIAVIGAYGDDNGGPDTGSAYIFRFNGSSWVEEAKLTASDGEREDYFGADVAIDENVVIIGAHGDDDVASYSGSAYVFRYNVSDWTEEVKLANPAPEASDRFGYTVSISGDMVVIGAPGDATDEVPTDLTYIYRHDGTDWVVADKLNASDAVGYAYYGCSVAVDGDHVLVGALGAGPMGSGAAYVYEHNDHDYDNIIDDCDDDNDNDGIPDAQDNCPDTIPGATVDEWGCPPYIPGDFDEDGDVDLSDLDILTACISGPAIPQNEPACAEAKLDGDEDVDQSDFGIFQRCYSGTELADPNCAD